MSATQEEPQSLHLPEEQGDHSQTPAAVSPVNDDAAVETLPAHADAELDEIELHEEDRDYSGLSKHELLEAARQAAKQEDATSAERVVRRIKEEMEHLYEEEREAARQKYLEENGGEEGFEFFNKEYSEFQELYRHAREDRKKQIDEQHKTREHNLKAKRAIIEDIKQLIDEPDHRKTLAAVRELQKKWKEVGAVPAADADELYKTYGALLDRFYDQLSIEQELKELDRKKNLEAKLHICERAEKLLEEENLNESIAQLNMLHEEFRSFGPVPKDRQEEIWTRFKQVSDKLFERKRQASERFKQQLQENLKAKQELCQQIEPLAAFSSDRIKEWNEKTKELLALQKAWEAVGPLPKEVAKDINKLFWTAFKKFFHHKNTFFDELEKQRAANLKAKQELVAKAQELAENEDYQQTAEALKKLQEAWKQIGPVPEKYRDSVYEQFKKACDSFFERKRSQRKEEDKQFVQNLRQKETICREVEGQSGSYDADWLAQKAEAFFAIGFVPKRDKETIVEKFVQAVDKYLQHVPGTPEEQEQIKLAFHAQVLKRVPNGAKRFRNQEVAVRNKISHIENDVALWQNNLAFFANSKAADKMKAEYQGKIEQAKKEIQRLKEQLKVITSIEDAAE